MKKMYSIVPACNPENRYAAGWDSNEFTSKKAAEKELRFLAEAFGTERSYWTVKEFVR